MPDKAGNLEFEKKSLVVSRNENIRGIKSLLETQLRGEVDEAIYLYHKGIKMEEHKPLSFYWKIKDGSVIRVSDIDIAGATASQI